jgi:hypothetical protein
MYQRPWRQNENAIILPITWELTGDDWSRNDSDVAARIVPIDPSNRLTPVDAPPPPREEPAPAPKPQPRPLEAQPVLQRSQAPAKPAPHRGRLLSAVPLLLLAVFLLFVLAYFSTK